MKSPIGILIKNAMKKKNLNNAEAAKKLGISEFYVNHLAFGSLVHISEALAQKLVKKLGVNKQILKMREAHNAKKNAHIRKKRKEKIANHTKPAKEIVKPMTLNSSKPDGKSHLVLALKAYKSEIEALVLEMNKIETALEMLVKND